MLNTLLFVHLVIAILLIISILLQKTSTDGLSGIGGGNNMGLMSGKSAANFLTKTTVILGIVFFINAIILANLSSNSHKGIINKIESGAQPAATHKAEENTLPIAK